MFSSPHTNSKCSSTSTTLPLQVAVNHTESHCDDCIDSSMSAASSAALAATKESETLQSSIYSADLMLSPCIESLISKIGIIETEFHPTSSSRRRSSTTQLTPLKLDDHNETSMPVSKLNSFSKSGSTKLKRRKSRSHHELAATTVGLREIAKKLGKTPLTWDAPPQTVLIVTKPNDPDLVKLTKKVALWLMSIGLTVYVQDTMNNHPLFYDDVLHRDQYCGGSTTGSPHQSLACVESSSPSCSSFESCSCINSDEDSNDSASSISSTSSRSSNSSSTACLVNNSSISSLKFWNATFCSTKEAHDEIDFVISLGGDGTVLFAAWLFQNNTNSRSIDQRRRMPPIIPFNLGSLGFLTVFDFGMFKDTISRILIHATTSSNDDVSCSNAGRDSKSFGYQVRMNMRMRFAVSIHRSPENRAILCDDDHLSTFHILNDVVVDRGPSPFVSQLELFSGDRQLTTVQADGLVVATPTGSTAYSLAAGGCLVHPDIAAILVTPICPHSLSFRPMLLPDTTTLSIQVPMDSRSSAFVSLDGRHRVQLFKGDKISVSASNCPIPTVCLNDSSDDWFIALEKCLGWNKRERQKGFIENIKF